MKHRKLSFLQQAIQKLQLITDLPNLRGVL